MFPKVYESRTLPVYCNQGRLYLETDKDVVPLCVVVRLQMSMEIQHLNVDLHIMKRTVGCLVNCIFNFPI